MISDADYELNAIVEDLGSLNKALCHFSGTGNFNIMSIAIDRGADVDNKEEYGGDTPLHAAAEKGHLLAAKLLIDKGATVSIKNENGYTPLHLAAEKGHLEVVEYLIESKADVHARNDKGYTPLHFAAQNGHLLAANLLIEKGATVSSIGGEDGYTPLHVATKVGYPADSGHTEIVKLLIENSADVDAKDVHGDTALHFAAAKGHSETAKLLIDKGAKVNTKGKNGNTPLHVAALIWYPETTKLLIENGADTTLKNNEGRTPIDNLSHYQRHLPELFAIYNIVTEHRTQQVIKEDGTAESVVNLRENDGKIISDLYKHCKSNGITADEIKNGIECGEGVINCNATIVQWLNYGTDTLIELPKLIKLFESNESRFLTPDSLKFPTPDSLKSYLVEISPPLIQSYLASAATNRPSTSAATNLTDPSEESAARSSAARRG